MLKLYASALGIIMNNLDEIKSQNRWHFFFFREVNKSKIDDCLNRLGSALERFNVRVLDIINVTNFSTYKRSLTICVVPRLCRIFSSE